MSRWEGHVKLTAEEIRERNYERIKRWREQNPRARVKERLAKYGLTPDEYDAMVEEQDGRCAICGEQRKLSVDHCHETGRVRGLLCVPCNGWLGFVEKYLPQAQAYLERTA